MNAKLRIWDEKYNCWSIDAILVYPSEEILKQGRTIQWSSGIKDKNGKEIFEGDIIEQNFGDKPSRGYVKFSNGAFRVIWPAEPYDDLGCMLTEYITVIGNVFDNPEIRVDYEPGA